MSDNQIRADKFLWAVRLFKTRSLATDACKKGRVLINGIELKPSRIVSEGDEIVIKNPPFSRSYMVISLLGNRVAAKLVANYITETTTEEELTKIREFHKEPKPFVRPKGTGRPTKKDRRIIDSLKSS